MLRRTFLASLSGPMLAAYAQQVIRSESRLVMVPVAVLDANGAYVGGLGAADFELLDDGTPRTVRVDTADTGVAPISLIVAVQRAAISAAVLAKVRKVGAMIQPLITGERGEAAVIAFDDDLHLVQEFTSDPAVIADAFKRLTAGSQALTARMLDAVELSGRMFAERKPDSRRVLLIISESRDRGSRLKLDRAVQLAQQEGIVVYAATYSAYATPFTAKPADAPPLDSDMNLLGVFTELARNAKKMAARRLAAETGGAQFSFLKQSGLERIITETGADLHSQYVLSFTPPNDAAPGLHRIEVRVKGGEKYHVRARRAYWVAE
ncbi:MAG: VWA domain-containing protein [Bryobacteraceae bacterium]